MKICGCLDEKNCLFKPAFFGTGFAVSLLVIFFSVDIFVSIKSDT